jgi:xanthine/CO dehydrogenase XdhC/CoxF family maturation factor
LVVSTPERKMKNFYLQILKNPQNIHDLVLATVIGTKGSTPQIEGSSALFSTSGLICGTIGGGVVEGK